MQALILCLTVGLSAALAASETAKGKVKVANKKFSCTFNLENDGQSVVIADSKVDCNPNKPAKKKVKDFKLSTDIADYVLSFNINPEKLTKANMSK